ncbi:MAG: hypothetical protein KAI47_12615 [Deltaproteobacteria bacterium]|nr:hypothetical protein [Deltaproteobacteria bacterium]
MTDNPYTPPASSGASWDPQASPYRGAPEVSPPGMVSAVPKVFGVLSIIFGSMVLLFSLLGSCASAFGRNMGSLSNLPAHTKQAQNVQVMLQYMAKIYDYMLITQIIFLVMSSVLLAVGIGQVKYRRWARAWSVYWGWAAIAALAMMIIISVFLIGPMYKEMFTAMSKGMPSGAMPMGKIGSGMGGLMGGMFGIMYIIFYAPYPVLLLLYFSKTRVKEAMDR